LKRLFLFFLICLAPCLVQAQELSDPDVTKLLNWSWELQKQQPFSQPYVSEFQRGPHHLFFIASHHGNQESAPTFQLIRQTLEQEAISLLVIEGVQASDGINPASFKKYLENNPSKDGFWPGGEMTYAVQLARAKGLAFIGAEPSEPQLLNDLLAQGETLDDILGFYVVRQVPQWRRQKALESRTQKQIYDRFLAAICRDFEIKPEGFDWSEFHRWYRKRANKNFDWNSLRDDESAPLQDGPYYTQRVAATVGRLRDQFIVQQICANLRTHKRVVVVYGGAHLATQRPVLEDLLGQPKSQYSASGRR
jgi:hypothetical protein